MIRDLFKNWIDIVDAICFVASSSSPRLTTTQKYIFSSIISLFRNDIADNFIPMLTFCDGKEPQILASLLDDDSTFKKSIYDHIKDKTPWYLHFNNSAIFESNREGKFTELFWELGKDSFKFFFTKLASLNSKSLNHSKNVLDIREKRKNKILTLRPKLVQGLILMEAIKQEINGIEINFDLTLFFPHFFTFYLRYIKSQGKSPCLSISPRNFEKYKNEKLNLESHKVYTVNAINDQKKIIESLTKKEELYNQKLNLLENEKNNILSLINKTYSEYKDNFGLNNNKNANLIWLIFLKK